MVTDIGLVVMVEADLVKVSEDIVFGLENAPEALIGLLQGRNFGKLVVQISTAWTRARRRSCLCCARRSAAQPRHHSLMDTDIPPHIRRHGPGPDRPEQVPR